MPEASMDPSAVLTQKIQVLVRGRSGQLSTEKTCTSTVASRQGRGTVPKGKSRRGKQALSRIAQETAIQKKDALPRASFPRREALRRSRSLDLGRLKHSSSSESPSRLHRIPRVAPYLLDNLSEVESPELWPAKYSLDMENLAFPLVTVADCGIPSFELPEQDPRHVESDSGNQVDSGYPEMRPTSTRWAKPAISLDTVIPDGPRMSWQSCSTSTPLGSLVGTLMTPRSPCYLTSLGLNDALTFGDATAPMYAVPNQTSMVQNTVPNQTSTVPTMLSMVSNPVLDYAILDNFPTTFMLRNIPNKYTRSMLEKELVKRGFTTRHYDFLYLPIDFRFKCNVGYAFVNLVTIEVAARFSQAFDQYRMSCADNSNKKCAVVPAKVQGLQANANRYRNNAVMYMRDEYRPVFYHHGIKIPPPTEPVSPMRSLARLYDPVRST